MDTIKCPVTTLSIRRAEAYFNTQIAKIFVHLFFKPHRIINVC